MLMLLSNRVRDFLPQGVDAPVGTTRGMRWRLPFGRLWYFTEDGLT